ncbi:MAG: MATE family efflux transporter [Paludibacteraceae bacterium]|nr:MATE family efflux transporter [Paludibacteraceae bacterium]
MLANITIPLVGLVDMTIAGHIADAAAIGGIAIGTMLFDLLYWNFGFLRISTSGLTAQAYGRKDRAECHGQLQHALKIALLGAVGILLIQWVFVTVALRLIPCSVTVAEQARTYFFVRIWAAPATLSLFAFKGWFIGMQDTLSAMLIDLIINAVNMIASYVLAVYTPLGVVGVAYGTVIAQYAGLILAAVLLITRYREAFVQLFHALPKPITSTVKMNADLFVRSLCFMIIYIGYTSLSSRYGDDELAISSLIMKLFMLFSYFVDGFAFAGEALIGRHWGERQTGQAVSYSCARLVTYLHLWCVGVGVVFALCFAFWGEQFISLLWPDVLSVALSWNYLPWLIAMPVLAAPAFMWDGIYVGSACSREIRNAMIYSAIGFVVVYVAIMGRMGIEAVLYAYFAHLILRGIYLTIIWKHTYDRQSATSAVEGH